MKGKNIAGCFDKANKKGVQHFVKFKCFWDDENDCAVFYLLDADGAAGKTIDVADSVDFLMTRIDFTDLPKTKLGGQMKDAGGGGVGSDLARALDIKNRTKDINRYLQTTCTLYGWQLALSNHIQRLLGEGSLNAMNSMQLLHSEYNLQEGGGGVFQVSQFKKLLQKLFNEKHKKYWTVGQGAIDGQSNFHKWETISTSLYDAYPSIGAPNKCGSSSIELIHDPAIISHI